MSRFSADSALSRLNRKRVSDDPLVVEVTRLALRLRGVTNGAFDPAIGSRLAELGYDRTFEAIANPVVAHVRPAQPCLKVRVRDGRVHLSGEGNLDLGGVAKGWTVDRVLSWMVQKGATDVLVDGGGDIAAAGRSAFVQVAGNFVVDIAGRAVATSSTRRRRWRSAEGHDLHHIINPRTGWSADAAIDTVSVVAEHAATADALATAILVDPERVLPLLERLDARAVVRDQRGEWWTTRGWEKVE